jgi:hypothetical protein
VILWGFRGIAVETGAIWLTEGAGLQSSNTVEESQ